MNWTYGTIYKRNSEMMLKALKNEKVPPNSLIIDLTNGLGQFTANPAVRQKYKLFAVDKYKNRSLQPEVFPGVYSYECPEFLVLLTERKAYVVIYDPPYRSISGQHILTNCNWEKSEGRINFNDRYGVSFPYTVSMIHAFYLKGFHLADKLLAPDGIYLVKLMNTNGEDDLRMAVLTLADLCGFRQRGDAYKLKSNTKNGEASYLYVFVRRQSNELAFVEQYFTEKAHVYRELTKNNLLLNAAEDYLRIGKKHKEKAKEWTNYYDRLATALDDEQKLNAIKHISPHIKDGHKSFKDNEESYNDIFDAERDNLQISWEKLQCKCLEINADLTNIQLIVGLFFEQLLKANRIDVANGSIDDKKQLELNTIGANVLVNERSHEHLSNNITRLRTQCSMQKLKKNQQAMMSNFFKTNNDDESV